MTHYVERVAGCRRASFANR